MFHETALYGVLFSPFILPAILAAVAAAVFSSVMERTGWSRFFFNPPWVTLAFGTICFCLLSI